MNTMNKYYLYNRSGKLYARIKNKNSDKRVSLGIQIPKSCFLDLKSKRVLGDSINSLEINKKLSKWDVHFFDNFYKTPDEIVSSWIKSNQKKAFYTQSKEPTLVGLYFDMFKKVKKGEFDWKLGSGYSLQTLQNYQSTGHILKEFDKDFLISEVDESRFDNVEDKKRCRFKINSFFNGFINHSLEKGYMPNTRAKQIKNIKSLINKGCEYYAYQIHSFQVPETKDNEVIALEPEQVEFIHKNKPSCPTLHKIWSYTRLMLHSCMRISDLIDFECSHSINGYYTLYDKKTRHESKFYLPKDLENTIKNYGTKWTQKNFRESLKKLLKSYPEFNQEKIVHKQNSSGEFERIVKPIYEWITPHKLRASGISWYLSLGWSEKQVREISGHADGSKAFYRYTAKTDKRTQNIHAEKIEQLLKVC